MKLWVGGDQKPQSSTNPVLDESGAGQSLKCREELAQNELGMVRDVSPLCQELGRSHFPNIP